MENELYHYGIQGQKWGIRRYQNKDGTLTPAGRDRYLTDTYNAKSKSKEQAKTAVKKMANAGLSGAGAALAYKWGMQDIAAAASTAAVSSGQAALSAGLLSSMTTLSVAALGSTAAYYAGAAAVKAIQSAHNNKVYKSMSKQLSDYDKEHS